MPGYSRRHYRRLSNGGPDTPETVARRLHHRECLEQATRERQEKFGQITADNFDDAIAFFEARFKELWGDLEMLETGTRRSR